MITDAPTIDGAGVSAHRSTVCDRPLVRYSCPCGYSTGRHVVLPCPRGDKAADEMRRHLAEQHSDVVGFGICGQCGAVTDYFHAHVPDLETDVWACERCGPKIPTAVDAAEPAP